MYRTPVYDAPPQEDAVMADGKFVEGMGIDFDIPETGDRKDYIKEKLKESAPPYMPKLTEEEIKNLSTWITKKEEEVKTVQKDPLYKFVVLVAGNLSVPVDKLFRFNIEHRHTEDRFFDVPGSDSQDDMILIKSRLTQSIADKNVELKTEKIFQELVELVDRIQEQVSFNALPFKGNGVKKTSILAYELTSRVELLNQSKYKKVIDGREISTTKLDDLTGYMNETVLKNRLPLTWADISQNNQTVEERELGFQDMTRDEVRDYLLFYMPEDTDFSSTPNLKTSAIYKLEKELSALEDLYARTDIGAIRKRMAAALNWIERKEVLGMGDMNEELVMGLDKATTLVRMNVPSMENVREEDAMDLFAGGLPEKSDRAFTTLFADLVAKQINLVHFLEGIRGSFDRNHARIRLTIERILSAMKKFSYVHGKVQFIKTARTFSSLDRLDY